MMNEVAQNPSQLNDLKLLTNSSQNNLQMHSLCVGLKNVFFFRGFVCENNRAVKSKKGYAKIHSFFQKDNLT